ncbi:MAG: hypothetical protein PHU85_11300 [Phycisphaerae bacterium]|nr:hypothetical protein [Phycisphaerae bacterium]
MPHLGYSARSRGTTRLVIAIATAMVFGLAASAPAQPKPGALAPPPERDTMARQARKTFAEASSQMHLGNYQQAADLFGQMLKRFPGNEQTPDAQLHLAACLRGQKKDDEFVKQTDLVIRTYAGTEIGLMGVSQKAGYYLGKNSIPEFVTVLKDACSNGAQPLPNYLLDPGSYHYAGTNCANLLPYYGYAFRDAMMKQCTKPEVAEQVLAALAGTFKQAPEKLPSSWLWVNCYLLLQANKDAEAEKAFKQYTEWWGADVRGRTLWWEYAQYLQNSRKKPDEARKIYDQIMQKYEGTDTAADAGAQVAQMMAADAAKIADLFPWGDKFVARYRLTAGANGVAALMLQKALELAPKDPAMAERAYKTMEADLGQMPPPDRLGRYESLIKLAVTLKDTGKITKYGQSLVADDMWSAYAYNRLAGLAQSIPELKPLVDETKKKRQIFDPLPNPPPTSAPADQPEMRRTIEAAKLLADLNVRLKDEQLRFAEEIAEDMFKKYADTAPTIGAVGQMVDYYFKQVMVEPRDKWMERMINAWPNHPKTEEVIYKRCVTDAANAEYDKLTRNCEAGLKRFPSSQYRSTWYQHRVKCYEVAKDLAGRADYIAKELNWSATNGNAYSIQQIIQAMVVPEGKTGMDVYPQAYVDWADKLGNTHLSLWCLMQAASSYENGRVFDRAVALCARLRNQKVDPSIAWRYQFSDINLLLLDGKYQEATAAAMQRLATEPRPQFRVYRQLSLTELGTAFGKLKKTSDPKLLSDKLLKIYQFEDDKDAAELMPAYAYVATEDPKEVARAADVFLKVARGMTPTDIGFSLYYAAAYRAGERYDDILNQANKAMPKAAHLTPRILGYLGQYYLGKKDPRAQQIHNALVGGFPSSDARDELDKRIEAARAAARPKGN